MIIQFAVVLSFLALSGALEDSNVHRRLSQDPLVNYDPLTQITDNAALDLDQQKIQERAGFGDFTHARKVYVEGGHSGSYAHLTLLNPDSNKYYAKGSVVLGFTEKGGDVIASLLEDASWQDVNGGNVTIKVLYTTSDEQSHHVDCMVGGLFSFQDAYRSGCLTGQGTIEIVPLGDPNKSDKYDYHYDTRRDNNNFRTIQQFSTKAAEDFRSCDDPNQACYFDDFQKFVDYYGETDYGDKWVLAASFANSTGYKSERGNADFSLIAGDRGKGRAEAMFHGSVMLNMWMYVIRQMEVAIQYCRVPCTAATVGKCENDALHEWDTALAYYAGSLEGQTGHGDGVLMYALADSRSREFRTSGYLSDEKHGTAYVNLEIVHQFTQAQSALLDRKISMKRRCDGITHIKNRIANLMKVPLVQTVYRYAWKRKFEGTSQEKHIAKGASYAAALLPYIFACKPSHAQRIYNFMKIGSKDEDINFSKVKESLEEVYSCLGVTCAEVGGLWKDGAYLGGSEPCWDASPIVDRSSNKKKDTTAVAPGGTSGSTGGGTHDTNKNRASEPVKEEKSSGNVGVALGATLAALMAVAILGLAALHIINQTKKAKNFDDSEQNNIAAVTAVSEVDLA